MSPDVPIADIPQPVLDEARRRIQDYFVPLLRLAPNHPTDPLDFGGSGTLVETAGGHFILTADHVWRKSDQCEDIGVVLEVEGGDPTLLPIPRDAIEPMRLVADAYSEEWGPDLALLRIPPRLNGGRAQVFSASREATSESRG